MNFGSKLEQVKLHHMEYCLLCEALAIRVFKLAIYHKFISDDEHYKAWADAAFDGYLKLIRDEPPSFEYIKELQQVIDNYRVQGCIMGEEAELKRFDWFFEKHFGIGLRWDKFFYPLHLSVSVPFITVTIGIGKVKEQAEFLPSITDQACQCPACNWEGTVWDCEGDVDGDGSLGCPKCLTVVQVKI